MAALNRLSQRIKENFQETTRDLSLLTGTGSSTTYFDTSDDKLKEITKLLESRSDAERLEGMKRIIAGMSKGRDMEPFFAQVVKNVVSQSIEIRKLVYIYLLRFASTNSDLVLLSINTFQKDLSDPSPLIRSMSLRVLTSIRVPVIQGIVMLGLKKLVNDRNPWVRKTVAGGLSKVYELDSSTLPQLIALLQTLLSSSSPLTLGASLTAFMEICPERLDLLHPYFRHICNLVVDADEWGQAVALEVLVGYARAMLEKPDGAGAVKPQPKTEKANGEKQEYDSEDEFEGLDIDLAMLLHCIKPLFNSRNPAVTLATAKAYWHLAPARHELVGQQLLVRPLLRLAGSSGGNVGREEIAVLSWEVLAEMTEERSWLFIPYHASFFLHSSEPPSIQKSKLRALSALITPENAAASMREFRHYLRLPDDSVAEGVVRAIGACVTSQSEVASKGLGALMKLLKSDRETLVAQAVTVLKSVILSSSLPPTFPSPQHLVARLAKGLEAILNPKARASVFWLVGQFAALDPSLETAKQGLGWEGVSLWVPDVLRKGVKGFKEEGTAAKLQIVTLMTKVTVLVPGNKQLELMGQYLWGMARYDADWDVRDRARFLHTLLRGVRAEKPANGDGPAEEEEDTGGVVLRREQVKFVVLNQQPTTGDTELSTRKGGAQDFDVATTSRVAGKKLKGYEELQDWTDDPTDGTLRDSALEKMQSTPTPTSFSSQAQNHGVPPAPLHMSSSGQLPRRALPGTATSTPVLASPASAQVPQPAKAKFQDLDSFLDSETESESESEDESASESGEEVVAGRGLGVQSGSLMQEYEYDEETGSEDGTEGTESEDDSSEDGENDRLYRG
ncbi:hypothetical protein B9479_005873 [Cryptococcus floricola]|uniref:Clathrin/coatomer adaptor adaptin-like N-terminal domain-containing protein n=1 Tax=Cryptococcus floricola TaxID=2591691 RepID=A0A5D3APL2_9TREE|nr:hypothetical protein B9479_005873 [Cryptococcus floricola]